MRFAYMLRKLGSLVFHLQRSRLHWHTSELVAACSHCTLHGQYSVYFYIFCTLVFHEKKDCPFLHACFKSVSDIMYTHGCMINIESNLFSQCSEHACVNLSELLGNYIQFGQWPKTAYGICLNFCTMTGKKKKLEKSVQLKVCMLKFYLPFQQQSMPTESSST